MKNTGWNLEKTYTKLPGPFFTKVHLKPVKKPKLVVLNDILAKNLGLDPKVLREQVEVLGGNQIPQGGVPIAKAYAGHQFGNFTMLGDGRAILLGEQITPSGGRFDMELKGSGKTPYSRGGDGRATLGPMLREYIISEAMHGLEIPTTRSLAVVTTGEDVLRETDLPGAILTRIASSHLRVGTFEFASRFRNEEELKALADYTIDRHFTEIKSHENPYLSLLGEVIKRQALLISKWQLVGFIHGVMNTDNMTISGETIDYGPCAFMDIYDPNTVFSSIDIYGRYAYGNQPGIAQWNLTRFAETLLPLVDDNQDKAIELCQEKLSQFPTLYETHWLKGMRRKLGLFGEELKDKDLIKNLLDIMEEHALDYTNTFRTLTLNQEQNSVLFEKKAFKEWYGLWKSRLKRQEESFQASQKCMKKTNPSVIPRNYRVEEALEAAVSKGDYSVMKNLLQALSTPYDYSPQQEPYAKLPPATKKPYRTFCGT